MIGMQRHRRPLGPETLDWSLRRRPAIYVLIGSARKPEVACLRETKLQEEVRKKSGRRGGGLEVEWPALWARGWSSRRLLMRGKVRDLVESGKQRDREEGRRVSQSGLEKRATQSSLPEISMFLVIMLSFQTGIEKCWGRRICFPDLKMFRAFNILCIELHCETGLEAWFFLISSRMVLYFG